MLEPALEQDLGQGCSYVELLSIRYLNFIKESSLPRSSTYMGHLNLPLALVLSTVVLLTSGFDLAEYSLLGTVKRFQTRSDTNLDCDIGKFLVTRTQQCDKCMEGWDDCTNYTEPTLCPEGQWLVLTPGSLPTCTSTIPDGYDPFKYGLPIPGEQPATENQFKKLSVEEMLFTLGKLAWVVQLIEQTDANPQETELYRELVPTSSTLTSLLNTAASYNQGLRGDCSAPSAQRQVVREVLEHRVPAS